MTDFFARFAKFITMLGGLSGALAGIAYVIGYVATKSFDEFIGIPSTTVLDDTFIRTGLMFVPNTAHHISAFLGGFLFQKDGTNLPVAIFIMSLLLLLYLVWIWPFSFKYSEVTRLILVVAMSTFLAFYLLSSLSHHVASSHNFNKGIIFKDPVAESKSVIDQLGQELNQKLRNPSSGSELSIEYGKLAVRSLMALALIPIILVWLARFKSDRDRLTESGEAHSTGPQLLILNANIHALRTIGLAPLLFSSFIMVTTLPANYGVMVLNRTSICGQLMTEEEGIPAPSSREGFILSDLNNPSEPIVFLEFFNDQCDGDQDCERASERGRINSLRIIGTDERNQVSSIRLWQCGREMTSENV